MLQQNYKYYKRNNILSSIKMNVSNVTFDAPTTRNDATRR